MHTNVLQKCCQYSKRKYDEIRECKYSTANENVVILVDSAENTLISCIYNMLQSLLINKHKFPAIQ